MGVFLLNNGNLRKVFVSLISTRFLFRIISMLTFSVSPTGHHDLCAL